MGGAPKQRSQPRYVFADATPFPLAENFIDTLVSLTDACVALFRADVAAESRRAKAKEARAHADDELRKVESLQSWVEKAVSSLLPENPKSATGVEAAAAKIAKQAAATLKQTRANVLRRRDAAIKVALGYRVPNSIREPVERFMLTRQLPNTRWSIEWRAGTRTEPSSGKVHASSPQGVSAEFTTELAPGGPWSGALRVKDLIGAASVSLPWPGKPDKWLNARLHKYVVTEVDATPKRESFTLRKSAKKPSDGFHVLMRGGQYATPVVTPISATGAALGASHALEGEPGKPVIALWRRLLSGAPRLVALRDSVIAVRLLDQSIEELDSPSQLAEAMLNTVAPFVREMRIRSKVPGRLVLKRDLGDGTFEEISLPSDDLSAKITRLPPRFVRHFDAIGIGLDATMQFVSRELPLQPGPPTENDIPHDMLDDDPDTERTERVMETEADKTLPRARPPERQDTPRDPTDPLSPVAGTINAA